MSQPSPLTPSTAPSRPPLPRLALRACFLAALLTLPVLTVSAGDEVREMDRELAVEQTCEDWQKVRRCADAEGYLQYECVAKSPMARFLAFFRSDEPEDDEVRVIRKAPAPRTQVERKAHDAAESGDDDGTPSNGEKDREDGATRSASTTSTKTTSVTSTKTTHVTSTVDTSGNDEETDGRYRNVVVKKVEKDLPQCRESN